MNKYQLCVCVWNQTTNRRNANMCAKVVREYAIARTSESVCPTDRVTARRACRKKYMSKYNEDRERFKRRALQDMEGYQRQVVEHTCTAERGRDM